MVGMDSKSLTKLAVKATLHCLAGCSIGEILGSSIGSGLNWSNLVTESLTIPMAFAGGYGLTMLPLLRSGIGLKKATGLALASDTISITTMEIIDTLIILLIPGALTAGPSKLLFWTSL